MTKKKATTAKNTTRKRKTQTLKKTESTNKNVKDTIWAIVLFAASICVFICFLTKDAPLCGWITSLFFGLFGGGAIVIPLIFVYIGVLLCLKHDKLGLKIGLSVGFLVFLSVFINVCSYPSTLPNGATIPNVLADLYTKGETFGSGGVIGGAIEVPLSMLTGKVITGILFFAIMLIVFALTTGITFAKYIGTPEERRAIRKEKNEKKAVSLPKSENKEKRTFSIPKITDDDVEEKLDKIAASESIPFTTNLNLPSEEPITKDDIKKAKEEVSKEVVENKEVIKEYIFPSVNLLTEPIKKPDTGVKEELVRMGEKLTDALRSFSVETKIIHVSRGPTVTRYELEPGRGVKISKIKNLSDDIALNLAAKGVRIEAPIPGKEAIGIEVPNQTQTTVYLREVIESKEFRKSESKVSAALGKDISGENIVIDIAKMPHLLIAGTTGTGKSVCINAILMSILYKATPEEVKLILIDPKMVEFTVYKGLPHLLIPIVTDPKKAAGALSWAVTEMLSRYQMFATKGVRDFNGYNRNLEDGEKKLPQILIVIDELSDLMMASPKEVEDAVCRLAQMARAAGMHLVLATQRPSAEVITGIIKANIPSRISLAVSSGINSRIILDDLGAEKLVGKGDMLYDPLGSIKPLRVQGCYVSDKEVENVVEFIKENTSGETYNNDIVKQIEKAVQAQQRGTKGNSGSSDTGEDENPDDEMLERAIEVVVDMGQASTSMLQRRVGLGYARAARLIDVMEQRGIVGPYQGSKPRIVLMSKMQLQEMKMRGQEIVEDEDE